jgi:hypothetical protein
MSIDKLFINYLFEINLNVTNTIAIDTIEYMQYAIVILIIPSSKTMECRFE